MDAAEYKKFTGQEPPPAESPATPILKEISVLLADSGNPANDKHPARTLQKMMFDTVSDPHRTVEEKWAYLQEKEPVHGMVSGEHQEYELAPDSQPQVFLLCCLALFAIEPALRKRPDVIRKIQNIWSDYAGQSEVGDHRAPSRYGDIDLMTGKPKDEAAKAAEEQWRASQRVRLPEFLSVTQRLLDILKAPWPDYNMFEHYSKYIPELKDLR
ncbi:MAG TPA: hypothetical protein VNM40_01035 [Candidatus Paceibacterota bacterium]|nr:hypothetical protein [Candidatus Paceibacterota bacterium]